MSLIQDALKRKAEETPEPVQQETPSVLHESPTAAPEPVGEPKPLLIILIVLLIAALLVALGGLAFSLLKAPAKPVEIPHTKPAEPVIEKPAEVPALPVTPPPAITPPAPVAVPAVEPVAVEPVAVEPPVTEAWPELKLTGIASSGSQRIAIINGRMLTVGRRIGEVIVREVRETQAVVEFRGERRTLHVDE